MGCYVVAEFLLTSVSRSPSAIAEPLVTGRLPFLRQKQQRQSIEGKRQDKN